MQKKGFNKLSLYANTIFSCFVYFIILVKCLFLFFVVWNFYLKKKHGNGGGNGSAETKLEKRISYCKNLTENLFMVLVSVLLIYLFNPYHENKYLLDDKYVKTLLFIYGILMLITFDWSVFSGYS
jgi:predicted MFS family arabinose efflux permease